jgi:hypothetical protein
MGTRILGPPIAKTPTIRQNAPPIQRHENSSLGRRLVILPRNTQNYTDTTKNPLAKRPEVVSVCRFRVFCVFCGKKARHIRADPSLRS